MKEHNVADIPIINICIEKHYLLTTLLGCLSYISVTKEHYQIGFLKLFL